MADYAISNVPRRVVYAASGVGPYAFTFEILVNTDVAVYRDDALLTLTTDYSVAIAANGTGTVTLVASPTGATQIAIVGSRAIQRTSDFVTGGDFFANTVNDELDSLTIFAQQNAEGLARALQAPQTDPIGIDMTLPRASVRANKTLAFDATGNPVTGEVVGDNRGNWAAGIAYNKRDIVKDTTNGNIYYVNTAHTSSGVLPIDTNADADKWDLLVDNASSQAAQTAAAASATSASTSATNAASSASAASTSASNASTSATNAAASATSAAASFDEFDDRYLGSKAANPTVDNDGDTLLVGAFYWNSVASQLRVWTGSAWVAAAPQQAVGTQEFTATAAQTTFTVTGGYNPTSVYAYLNGVLLDDADYTATNGSTVVLASAAALDDVLRVVTFFSPVDTIAIRDAAAASATAAAASESAAATSATNSSDSASNAATSATNASNSANAAAASFDAFDDRYLGSKSSDPTVDNDGDTLLDGALYFDTTNNVLKVYDLGNTVWRRTTPTTTDQANINTVSGIAANVTSVAGNATNINTVAGISANVTTVATNNANVTTVADNIADIIINADNIAAIEDAVPNAALALASANAAALSETAAAASAVAAAGSAANALASEVSAAASAASADQSETNAAASAFAASAEPYDINTNTDFGAITDAGLAFFADETANLLLTMTKGAGAFNYGSI
jgi:hypothetical protein